MKSIRSFSFFLLVLTGSIVFTACNLVEKPESTPVLITFNPNLTYGSVTDADGNIYKTITIGTQTWMAENLRTTKYRNGVDIPNVTDNTAWKSLTTGAWKNYNAASNSSKFGKLYNWYAVTDSRNIAPTGWHLPTAAEWTTLITYLGGESVAGGKLKEIGTDNWNNPNTGATNESGFTALPGGCFDGDTFYNIGGYSYWWSSTLYNTYFAMCIYISFDISYAHSDLSYKQNGLSVRCVKD